MKKFIIAAGLTVGLVNIAQAGLTNPGFETGDFTGWTLSFQGYGDEISQAVSDMYSYPVPVGNYLASLWAGADKGVYTVLSQTFSANAGEKLSISAAFIAHDESPYADDAYVRIWDGSTTTTLWRSDVIEVGDYGATMWESVIWEAPITGTYTLSFGVANERDNAFSSQALFDVNPVPVPNALLLLGSGLLGLIGIRRRLQ